jgi:hypothetical protein
MYLVGADHPHKTDARRLLERLASDRERLVTDAEVFQEILHRYSSIGRPDAIQPAFDLLLTIVDQTLPIERDDVLAAKDLLATRRGLSARDAIHAAVMLRHGIGRILTFDRGFDALAGIVRLPG